MVNIMLEANIAPTVTGGIVIDPIVRDDDDIRDEPLYQVVIHNDDVTTFDYVIRILEEIFELSEELAEHIAWTAHEKGLAIVIVRPRPEAERLVKVAHARARLDGFPLTFTIEPVSN